MNNELTIRPMQPSDVECVSRIEAECFTMPWSANAFSKVLEDLKSVYLVAESEGQIVGMCGLTNILGEGDINNVAVKDTFRGRGIAYAMLTQLIRLGEAAGVEEFTLEVRVSNAQAIHVYEKLGFTSEGIRPRFYEKPVEDAMIMWRRKMPAITTEI